MIPAATESPLAASLRAGAFGSRAIGIALWRMADRVEDARSIPAKVGATLGFTVLLIGAAYLLEAIVRKADTGEH